MNSDSSRRILFVVNDSWFFKSHRLPIAIAATENGHETHLTASEDHTTESIVSSGVHFHSWHIDPRSRNPFQEIRTFYNLYSTIKRLNPDLLHLVTVKSVLYGGIIARILNTRAVVFAISGRGYIYSDSNSTTSSLLKALTNKLYRFVLSHNNATVIVQNMNDHAFFVKQKLVPTDRIRLIPGSGVDLDQYNIRSDQPKAGLPIVLFASRMLWDKGVKEFVDAAKIVNTKEKLAEFILAGTVDIHNPRSVPQSWLEQLPEQFGIRWIGHCEEIDTLIAKSSIVVLPSRYGEGVPKILIEAAAMGRAIVTTNWPGCRDVVQHEYNGLLVEPGDTHELANSIKKLVQDTDMRIQFGRNGRDYAEKYFSIVDVVETTLEIYRDLDSSIPYGA